MKRVAPKLIISVIALLTIAIPVGTVAWFMSDSRNTKKSIDGEVGLRSYFYTGDGSDSKPYEIVSPVHYYNLTRLQNLGIFSGKTFFKIGHTFEGDSTPSCVMEYDNNGDPIKVPYLDMKSLSYGNNALTMLPIGSEGAPFVGTFDGQGIPIRNLKVTGYPEDIGVFGYVDYTGVVKNLVLDGVTDNGPDGVADTADDNKGVEICSMGYNATPADYDNQLFSADIDNIFTSAHYFANANVSIARYTYDEIDTEWSWGSPTSLKTANGSGGTTLSNLNGVTTYATNQESSNRTGNVYNKAYFTVNFPEVSNDPFTYSWTSSSSLLQEEKVFDIDGDGTLDPVIVVDMDVLKNSSNFGTAGQEMQVDCRISLNASVEVDGYKFTRVIQSYVFEFRSNGDIYENVNPGDNCRGIFSCNIFCDYSASPEGAGTLDYKTNYHHGNNIGFLVGHLNGTLTDSYVYNARMTFNQTEYTPILTESDTGLVGEIGKNVINSIDPEIGLVTDGSTGVMNLTKIYKTIRSDMNANETHTLVTGRAIPPGATDSVNFFSYDDFKAPTFNLYADYLRHDSPVSGDWHYIAQTSTEMNNSTYTISSSSDIKADFNKVDFIWNKVIEENEEGTRNLGVFKIVSSYLGGNPEESYGTYYLNGIGSSQILNKDTKTKVYFSTAEYDHTVSNSISWSDYSPLRGVHLPSYGSAGTDVGSFEYPFSRDHNYVFELDLEDMASAGTNNYMYNTDSAFLTNYLSSVLRDGHGRPIAPNSPSFGFMFARKSDSILERPTALSSYMPVGVPDFGKKFSADGGETYYPPNCIAFSIKNDFGGNVSIVGNGSDISIYSVDTTQQAKNNSKDKILYSMRATAASGIDGHRYFTYDVASGATGTEAYINPQMNSDNAAVYGHIFKLPKGDYVVGSRTDKSYIYFLAVQGQDEGEIGDTTMADVGYKIENVAFLNEQPTLANFMLYDPDSDDEAKKNALKTAGVSFSANFNDNQIKTFYVKTKEYNGNPVLWIDFEDGATPFVTYLTTYSADSKYHYIQDVESPYHQINVAYRST